MKEKQEIPEPSSSTSWKQMRIMQHVMLRVPEPENVLSRDTDPWFDKIDARYRERAVYFHELTPLYSQLGLTPGELRLSIEPLHPLPDNERDVLVRSKLELLGFKVKTGDDGLSLISRALVESYNPADLFGWLELPDSESDLSLFDPLTGFMIWPDGDKIRNGWLGNQLDLLEVSQQPEPLKSLLIQTQADHFSYGKSLLLRFIGPYLKKTWQINFDEANIPTVLVETQADLEALAYDLIDTCQRSPLNVTCVFRGQTGEYALPDRKELALANICPYSDVRDHSIIPSMYRNYDKFLNDLHQFKGFIAHLLNWNLYSDLIFGDPATYWTLDGNPYEPKEVPSSAYVRMSIAASGSDETKRIFKDIGSYTIVTVTDTEQNVIDQYIKTYRHGHDAARRHLVLQHYGAPTPLIDVTNDIRVAEWFALNNISVEANGLSKSQTFIDIERPAIYVFLLLDGLSPFVNTEELASAEESLRPHRQACGILGGAGNLYRNAASRFIAMKIKFAKTFVPAGLMNARYLFPGPDEDNALKKLLHQYDTPEDLPNYFPVYWFPE